MTKIANQILQLSLIEVAELTDLLKLKLGINDEVMMQQLGAHYGGPVVAVAGAGDDASGGAKEEKTAFDVKLEVFDAAKKLKVIKEVRAITGLGLKEAKEFVEGVPKALKEGASKEDCEAAMKEIEGAGGVCSVILIGSTVRLVGAFTVGCTVRLRVLETAPPGPASLFPT